MSLYPMSELVVKELKEYQEQMMKKKLTPNMKPTKEQFAFLLSGVSSTRIMPGIQKHMGYEKLFVCNHKDSKEARRHLRDFYHIEDKNSLEKCMKVFYRSHEEYLQFLPFWNQTSKFKIEDLNPKIQIAFKNSMDYAALFYPIVKEKGFLAWDVNEIIGMYRKAYACGIIKEKDFWDKVNPLVERVQQVYDGFKDYAISLICGAIYFNFRQSHYEQQSQQVFKLQKHLVNDLFSKLGVWNTYEWLGIEKKKFYLDPSKMKQLLTNYEGPKGCIASDRIIVDGNKVGYMYREASLGEWDSGWRFLAGDESQAYLDDEKNVGVYLLNTLCNYDQEIIDFLDEEIGSVFVRREDHLLHKQK